MRSLCGEVQHDHDCSARTDQDCLVEVLQVCWVGLMMEMDQAFVPRRIPQILEERSLEEPVIALHGPLSGKVDCVARVRPEAWG